MRRSLILLSITLIISSFLFCQDIEALFNQANSKLKIGELKIEMEDGSELGIAEVGRIEN